MQDAHDPVTAEQLLAEGRALRALAQSLLGADADDALQEANVAALARPDAARRLGPWLTGTVRRLAARWRRDGANRRAREAVVARGEVDAASDPARVAEAADTAAAVANAVRALDEPFRSVIVLRYWRGMLPEQIAAELGVPHNTVRSRLQRGLERLRAQLDAKYGERPRWSGALVLLAHREDTVVAGGALLALGVAMKTKLILAAALLVAAAFAVPLLLDEPPLIERTDSTAAAEAGIARVDANTKATAASEREAAPSPPAGPPAAGIDRNPSALAPPERVAPWFARFVVVDENERPVEGATITIHGAMTAQWSQNDTKRAITDRRDAFVMELSTDRDGVATATFDLEGVLASATKPPRQSTVAMLRPADADATTKLVLDAAVVLRGIVLRADGSPAAGAAVSARVNGFSTAQRGRAPQPDPVKTGDDGRFAIPLMEHGGYALTATLDGKRTLPVRAWITTRTPPEVELVFPGGLSLRGVVVDAKGGAVAAQVRAWREVRDDATRTPFDADDERAGHATDDEGRFAIDVRKRARYELIASAEGHGNSDAVWVETTSERPHAEARLVLRPLATIEGVVQHGDGKPFAGVGVFTMLDGWNNGISGKPGISDRFVLCDGTTSRDDGRFTLTVDPGTPWNLVAQPFADSRWFRVTIENVAAGRADVIVTIRDEELAGCVVRGDVSTAIDARPILAFDVDVVEIGGDGEPRQAERVTAKVDAHRFELPPLPLGKTFAIDVRPSTPDPGAQHETLAPARFGPFTTVAAGIDAHVRVEAWGELPLQILTADGKPARDVFVFARREPEIDSGVRGTRRVDASGRNVLPKCVPGPHRIVVATGNAILHEQEVLVTAGLNPEVIVRLPK